MQHSRSSYKMDKRLTGSSIIDEPLQEVSVALLHPGGGKDGGREGGSGEGGRGEGTKGRGDEGEGGREEGGRGVGVSGIDFFLKRNIC